MIRPTETASARALVGLLEALREVHRGLGRRAEGSPRREREAIERVRAAVAGRAAELERVLDGRIMGGAA